MNGTLNSQKIIFLGCMVTYIESQLAGVPNDRFKYLNSGGGSNPPPRLLME